MELLDTPTQATPRPESALAWKLTPERRSPQDAIVCALRLALRPRAAAVHLAKKKQAQYHQYSCE
jgi:hypothetical protein